MLASGNSHGIIQRWDATTGTRIGKPLTRRNKNAHITSLVAWNAPDGEVILASLEHHSRPFRRSTIRCWDANTGISIGKPLMGNRSQSDGGGVVEALAAWTGRDGPTLALGYGDGTIRRCDAGTGEQIREQLTGQRAGISALTAWTGPDGHVRMASGGSDGTILLWDAETGEQIGSKHSGLGLSYR
jgi:WD40 repeat protein